jgi:hypothetical protein
MRHCIAGEIIFHEGDMPAHAFIIEEGEVEIFKTVAGGRVLLATLGKGEIFGEMGLIDDHSRSASAVARVDVQLRVITREMIQQVIPTQPREFVMLMRALIERLRETNNKLSKVVDRESTKLQVAQPGKAIEVRQVTIKPASEVMQQLISAKGIIIQSLPYRIGALPEGEEPNPLDWNQLTLRGVDPNHVSRHHCAIQRNAQGVILTDRGSTTGTLVNGVCIGAGSADYRAVLKQGGNRVVMGTEDSPYKIDIIVE